MTATTASSQPLRTSLSRMVRKPSTATMLGLGLGLPALAFLAVFLLVPAVRLVSAGFLTQNAQGVLTGPVTVEHYVHFFGTSLYSHVLFVTLRISLVTAALAAVLGYPVAMVMVRSHPAVARVVTFITIAPLIVSVVVRTYGWQLILGNGPTGLLNWLLLSTGLTHAPVRLLYSEAAVVIGSLHVFLPMMVLPLASALGKIEPTLGGGAPHPLGKDRAASGGSRTHPRHARLESLPPRHLPAEPAGPRGRFHAGVLADRRVLRHARHARRHQRPDAGQSDRSANHRRL